MAEAVGVDLEHVLRPREITQLVVAEVAPGDVGRHAVPGQLLGGPRADDLAAVGDRRDARRPVHRGAEVVAVAERRLAGVQPHPDADHLGEGPVDRVQGALAVDGCEHGVVGGCERGVEAVAGRLDHDAVALLDRLAQDLVVAGERVAHRLGVLLPKARRTLEVREQERHGAGGQVGHSALPTRVDGTGARGVTMIDRPRLGARASRPARN